MLKSYLLRSIQTSKQNVSRQKAKDPPTGGSRDKRIISLHHTVAVRQSAL
ncbi:hypothetical protein CupriaWKF_15040 [Cupriavidus sp. WKF15]|nr:hypothetical protein [Cupriavidus sp. WKF15]WER47814.1 hypothetical protein CupriaWKF_15040 [Cupriavidus sp. WKF15]